MDWQKIIRELIESGMTQTEIATACGTGQGHISDLARGKYVEPKFNLGATLINLHKSRCSQSTSKKNEPAHEAAA